MHTLEARDNSTRRVSLRQRLTAGVALSVAAASVVIVDTSMPALASSVSAVTVTPTRAVAGAKTTYTVGFTATTALTINVGTITLTGAGGTLFPLVAADYTVKDGVGAFTAVSVLPTGSAGNVTITTPVGVAASDVVAVVALGVTNPGAGGPLTTSVATSTDTTALPSFNYTITTPTAVTAVTVPTVSPAKASLTNALYSVHFTAATALVADFDTITLTAPATTVFPLVAADYMVNAGGGTAITEDLTPTQSSPNSVTLNVPPSSVGGGAMLVNASNVTNPSTASATETMTVSTSQDATIGTSTNYTIIAATTVTGVAVVPSPTLTGATASYTISFVATSALTGAADTITIVGPGGTLFPLVAADYTVNGTTVTVTPTGSAGNVTITTPTGVTAGATVTVVATGITNPTAGGKTLTVATTQDSVAVTSSGYTITPPTAVTAVTAAVPVPNTATAVAAYSVGFTATSALVAGVDTITIVAPGTTTFTATAGNYTVNGTLVTASPTGGGTNTVTLTTPVAITAGMLVTVRAVRVTNPAAVVGMTLSVATSADTTAVASNTYTVAGAAVGTQVTTAVVTPIPANTGSSASYTVTFNATTLLAINSGTITLTAPAGTVFPLVAANYTVNGTASIVTPTGGANVVTITTHVAVAVGAVIVVATGVTNPAAGVVSATVATSADTTPLASTFYTITAATGGGGPTTPATPVRVSGTDRFGTAIAASQVEFPTALSAGAVVLARSDDYPDALVGTALATARNAPLLFANGGALTAGTVTEVQRVLPAGGTVYLLGGLAAIPASVATTLTGLGFVVVRYGGADRFGTALLVADALGDPSTVLLATGINFPDALAAGPAAAHVAGVVLLTDGTVLTAAVQAYLTGHPGKVYAIGGPAVTADPSATPLSGADRYGTAAAVAAALFTAPNNVGVASGTQFPDALSGGAFQGHFGGPIVLTDPGVLPAPTSTYLTGAKTTIVTTSIFGGTAALSTAVQASISTALGL